MFELDEVTIDKVFFHALISEASSFKLDNELFVFDNYEDVEILKRIFLKPFLSATSTYEFTHTVGIELNPLFNLSRAIYDDGDFLEKSKNIFSFLKSVSKHPNIKDGDVFVIKYNDVKLKNKFYEGVGVYKIENKESFVETNSTKKGESICIKSGISGKKLDKACLILFTEEPYTILIIDNGNVETDYWKNDFLNVVYKNDSVNSTNQFLDIAKTFVTDHLETEYEITKTDKIDYLNKTVDYFKKNDSFNENTFLKEVFDDSSVIASFQTFKREFTNERFIELDSAFDISDAAVKKQARVFKSILKLDKNFHVYIHGDKSLIEKGYDERVGKSYYKIYFDEET